jgi:hypothetical protein
LVLGIVWLGGLGSILAVIFGLVGRSQIRKSGGRQTGGGMAVAGMVLGFVGIAGLILWIVFAVAVANNVNSVENNIDTCLNNPHASVCGNTGNSGNAFNSGTTGNTGNASNSGTITGSNLLLRVF